MMKRTILSLIVALSLGTTITAATLDKKDNSKDRKEMSTRQATRMASELKLDDKQQAWFIPLYAEYQDTLRSLRRPQGKPEAPNNEADGEKKKKEKKNAQLTNEEATKQIEQTFEREEMELKLKREYYAKFQQQLTPQQLHSIFCRQATPNRGPQQGGNRQGGNNGMHPGGGMMPGGFGGGFGGGGDF